MTDALTCDAVTAVLRARLDRSATCTALHRGAKGNGQETWFVGAATDGGEVDLVLRRTAEGGPLEWTDRRAEADVMNLVADGGFPVPRVLWVADVDTELDRPYLMMARASGEPVTSRSDRQLIAEDLARWLARLHTAAIEAPTSVTDASTATRQEIARWRATFRTRQASPWPLVDALLADLERSLPDGLQGEPAILLWGDAGLHNALADERGITALLDWELAHAGHPLEDLAAAIWLELDGPVDTDRVIAVYADEAGRPVDRDLLDRFVALVCVTRSIMILGAGAAFAAGRTSAPSLAGLALDLPVQNLGRAAKLAGWGSVVTTEPPAARPASGVRPDGPELSRGVARHLATEILPTLEDRHARRGLRTAVALLETAARQAEGDAWFRERAIQRDRALRDELARRGLADSPLDDAVAGLERDEGSGAAREAVHALLLEDLADRAALLTPLRELYQPTT